MRNEVIEAKREIVAGYTMPGGRVGTVHFRAGKLTEVPTDVFAALRATKDSPIEAALAARLLIHTNAKQAQLKFDGEEPFVDAALSPIQAAAQTYASTSSQTQAIQAAEAVREPQDPKGKRR